MVQQIQNKSAMWLAYQIIIMALFSSQLYADIKIKTSIPFTVQIVSLVQSGEVFDFQIMINSNTIHQTVLVVLESSNNLQLIAGQAKQVFPVDLGENFVAPLKMKRLDTNYAWIRASLTWLPDIGAELQISDTFEIESVSGVKARTIESQVFEPLGIETKRNGETLFLIELP